MLFKGGLCTLGRLPIPLLSALGPMRRMFEVLGFAGNIYRRPDTSIKGMQLTDVTSYASRWRHRLLLHWRQLCCTCVNLEYLLTMSPSRLVWRRGLREGGLLLPRSLGLGPGSAGRQHEGVLEDAWQEHRPSHQALWLCPEEGQGSLRGSGRRHQVLSTTQQQQQNNRSFLRPPNLSKRESFRFKELNFQKCKFPILSILTVFTFSFITLTKLAYFSGPIPVSESALNLLSPGVISCLILWSFDIATIRNRFTFGQILRNFFWKNIFKRKFSYWSNTTFFSSNPIKSGTVGKSIARGVRKWYWTLFSVKIGARYGGGKLTGHLIWAIL